MMPIAGLCPLCGAADPMLSVDRESLPVFQNVVHQSRDAAMKAACGQFRLGTCRDCGFSWNTGFDADVMVYDESYDNHVASAVFAAYYRELVLMLIERFGISDGTVYDIGCGKGEFLRIFAALAPGVRCIGIDPSCTPVIDGNFELRCMRFDASVFTGDAKLVLLRHVLEHIDQPIAFLSALRGAMPAAPLFVEVPDLEWILEKGAFWDFCYEHCNYFTPATLTDAMRRSGFDIIEARASFGGQYQWALVRPGQGSATPIADPVAAIAKVAAYATHEAAALDRLCARADKAGGLVIWGMATKGVILSLMLGGDRVRGGIDMNRNKHGRFAPGSAVEIHPADWLETLPPGSDVVVMNPNYLGEITAITAAIRPDLAIAAI
jgi:SAM-dependent methyltransferase